MPTVTFSQDTEVKGLGTVTFTFDNGHPYSKRIDANKSDAIKAFVAELKEKQTALDTEKESVTTIEELILNEFNKKEEIENG